MDQNNYIIILVIPQDHKNDHRHGMHEWKNMQFFTLYIPKANKIPDNATFTLPINL